MFSHIESSYNFKTALAVSNYFNNIGLPMPAEREQFTVTTDGGYLIFLDDAACVMRMTPDGRYPRIKDPNILRPIFSRLCGDLRADIMPGVTSPVKNSDIETLRKKLASRNIRFYDRLEDNAGYLPHRTINHRNGVPVVIDLGSCIELNDSVKKVQKVLGNPVQILERFLPKIDNLQPKLFAAANDAFAMAWPEKSEHADPELMARAWRVCAALREQGIFVAQWKNRDPEVAGSNYKNMEEGSANYAAFCRSVHSGDTQDKGENLPELPSPETRPHQAPN